MKNSPIIIPQSSRFSTVKASFQKDKWQIKFYLWDGSCDVVDYNILTNSTLKRTLVELINPLPFQRVVSDSFDVPEISTINAHAFGGLSYSELTNEDLDKRIFYMQPPYNLNDVNINNYFCKLAYFSYIDPIEEINNKSILACVKYDGSGLSLIDLNPTNLGYSRVSDFKVPVENFAYDKTNQILMLLSTQIKQNNEKVFEIVCFKMKNSALHPEKISIEQRQSTILPIEGFDFSASKDQVRIFIATREEIIVFAHTLSFHDVKPNKQFVIQHKQIVSLDHPLNSFVSLFVEKSKRSFDEKIVIVAYGKQIMRIYLRSYDTQTIIYLNNCEKQGLNEESRFTKYQCLQANKSDCFHICQISNSSNSLIQPRGNQAFIFYEKRD